MRFSDKRLILFLNLITISEEFPAKIPAFQNFMFITFYMYQVPF